MKKLLLLFTIFLTSGICSAQQHGFLASPFLVPVDTNVYSVKSIDKGQNQSVRSVYHKGAGGKMLDCYDGMVFAFRDTLVPGDFSQIGLSGKYRITLHANPLNTVKRNVFVNGFIFQYDSTNFELRTGGFSNTNYPIRIVNKNTGVIYVEINDNGTHFFNVYPSAQNTTIIGTVFVKIVIQ